MIQLFSCRSDAPRAAAVSDEAQFRIPPRRINLNSKIITTALLAALAICPVLEAKSTRRGVSGTPSVEEDAHGSRRRGVIRVPRQAAELTGRVLDATTGSAISGASVSIGNQATSTDEEGRFEFEKVGSGTYEVRVTRWGYVDFTQSVTLTSGSNQIELRVTPGPAAELRKTTGEVYSVDYGSLEFGYVVTFVGYESGPHLDVCVNGTERVIERAEIARVNGPVTVGNATACCRFDQAQQVSLTLKSGEQVTGILSDSCDGSKMDVIAFDRATGQSLYIPMTEIAHIIMP